ncbi:aminodeoxychorismate lyase [Mycolicibacterium sp. 22603]|uniref:aminodeoxychorismate lyase n=1 Tax=Mycolicibacterium sp. 22603 TaxID=3453950 RepID=UPI003F846F9D
MSPRSTDVVVTLDGVAHSPSAPLIGAGDPMVVRGAGVFETVLLRAGDPCLLDAHLARLEASAALVGLPAPDLRRWRAAIEVALARWPGDGVLRLAHGPRVSFVMVSDLPERALRARRDGVAAITLDPGPRGRITGAKSLSYAVNSAALRYAQANGADDVIFVDAAGTVLEGPRSSVVIAMGEMLLSPPPTLPILAGTTVAALFDIAPRCAYRPLTVADLVAAQGVWLVSAVTLAARVHTLDGMALAPAPAADDLARWVETAITG